MPLAQKGTLILDHASAADASAIGTLTCKAFQIYPYFQYMQPMSKEALQGWEQYTLHAINDPNTITLKVLDGDKIVASGRWVRPAASEPSDAAEQPGHEADRVPDSFMASCDEKMAGPLFGSFEQNRAKWAGCRRHWYMELLATDPDAHRKGAAGMILKYGCDAADADGLECYIDASPMGAVVYEKFGWKWEAEQEMEHGLKYVYGLRQPKKTT